MLFLLRHVRHLTRYFFVLGGLAFYLHYQGSVPEVSLVLMGPAIFLAHFLHTNLSVYIPVEETRQILDFGYLLPVTLFYFTLTGYLFKQLWNERGFMRTLTMVALFVFMAAIHYMSWKALAGYAIPNP